MKRVILLGLVLLGFSFISNAFATLNVVYPNVNDVGKDLFAYSVLKLALENSGEAFNLKIRIVDANDARIRRMIQLKTISISDFGTSPQFEKEFLPVYFPIDLGLNGWRILLIHKDKQLEFLEIKTLDDLKKMIAGQGLAWTDVKILENAGLRVVQAPHITNLFRMIEKKRFDYLPLGANEAHSLLEKNLKYCQNVRVEQKLLLIYPFARFFFVHKDNKALHDAVYKGLVRSFENGSFLKLFRSHHSNSAIFNKANLKSRKQILIQNPHLSKAFKKIPKKYFFDLNMLD